MNDVYDIGDEVTMQATFRNEDGDLTTPTATTLRYMDPSGNVTVVNNAALTSGGTGIKKYAITVDEEGDWFFRFTGTGAVTAAEEGRFKVRPQQVPDS